jgi:sensor histidine kinase regulating citrate/malate metabolism
MQQQEIKIHKLYHDIGNHLKTIQILVSNGENQQAKDYAEGLLKEYNNIHKNYYCNNNIINAVLSQKMKICGQSKIEHDIDVHIPDQLPIRDIDLMSVYANLLDNAIEGCRRNLECNNYIKVKTSVIGNYFAVKIINSKSKIEENSENSKYFPTRKKNKSMHGYGMKILEEIVQRYDGQREFIDLGEEFSAMVLLKIQ